MTQFASTPRCILVTGAGSGIGAGISTALAQDGHHVVVTDLSGDAARDVAQAIVDAGGSAESHVLDVTSDESVATVLQALTRPVDVLVNNAGLQHVSKLEDFPIAKWDLLVQVMLVGVARLTRAVLPGMRGRGFGRVVNIGSIHSLVASPYKSAYVAAKHGLLGFSKVLALETADTDITINTICPTYVKTPLVDRQIADQAKTRGIPESQVVSDVMLKPMPKGVFITFEELAGITAFLMSPAARNITGHTIDVDGGWTVQSPCRRCSSPTTIRCSVLRFAARRAMPSTGWWCTRPARSTRSLQRSNASRKSTWCCWTCTCPATTAWPGWPRSARSIPVLRSWWSRRTTTRA
jgi:3-hydroxybutyrate dehydrogenase